MGLGLDRCSELGKQLEMTDVGPILGPEMPPKRTVHPLFSLFFVVVQLGVIAGEGLTLAGRTGLYTVSGTSACFTDTVDVFDHCKLF